MNAFAGKVVGLVSVVAAVAAVAVSMAGPARADQKTGAAARQAQGSWTLVSQHVDKDGKRSEPFGTSPRGSMMLSPDGRFSIILMRERLPQIASNNRAKATPEEYQAIAQGSMAYFGTYTAAGDGEVAVRMRIEGSTFPNRDGEEQTRAMTIVGDELTDSHPAAAVGGTAYIVWKRVR